LLKEALFASDDEAQRTLYSLVCKLNHAYLYPVQDLELVLTDRCNLSCSYCFESASDRRLSMTAETARRAIDLLFAYSEGVQELSITLFGGEPFLNFDVFRGATEYAEQRATRENKAIRFNCTSNCTVLTDEMLEFVAAHHIPVLASVDGLAESHDRHRKDRAGRGTFMRVATNLKKLKEVQGFVGAKITVMPDNVCSLFHDTVGLYEMGVRTFVIGYATGTDWTDEQTSCYWHELLKLRAWQHGTARTDVVFLGLPESNPPAPVFRCRAGVTSISVRPDGQVFPCSKIQENGTSGNATVLGDVSSGLLNLCTRIGLTYGTQLQTACKRLKLDARYSGGCIASNLSETGSPFIPGMRQYAIESGQFPKR
jgi:uncharacterized protein